MATSFSPNSSVVQEIKRILRERSEGLTIPQIRRELVKRGRPGVFEGDIQEILKFPEFRRLVGGKYILREMEMEEEPVEEPFEEAFEPYNEYPSTLSSIPDLSKYVIFDIETTGLDPEEADFFQLGAIKVVDGRPVEARNWYAHVDTGKITYALKLKLHFEELELEEKIAEAPDQRAVVEEFRKFVGDLPLVAHNGTFDYRFLKKADPSLDNELVDSLELICLAFPELSSHSLENLAEHFGLRERDKRWVEILTLDRDLGISRQLGAEPGELFHSALFDCLVLYVLLQDALAELRKAKPGFKAQFHLLSPTLAGLIGAPPEIPQTPPANLRELIGLRDWPEEVASLRRQPVEGLTFNEATVMGIYEKLRRQDELEERKAQKEMLRQATRIFLEGRKAMIEAPTGTGKTYGYLLPAITYAKATGRQVIISTSTKNLQDQLLDSLGHLSDSQVVSFPFNFTLLKGRQNYPCLRRLFETFIEAFYSEEADQVPFEEKLALLYLLRFAERSRDGDMEGVSFWFEKRFPILTVLKNRVQSEDETCYETSCPYYRNCRYLCAKERAKRADILVVNHALLLLLPFEGEPFDLVIDEAHNLEDAATTTWTETASQEEIEGLLGRLLSPDGKRGVLVRARRELGENGKLVERALGSVRRLRRRAREFGGYLKEFVSRQGVRFHPRYGATWRLLADPRRVHYFAWQNVEGALQDLMAELDTLSQHLNEIETKLSVKKDSDTALSLAREVRSVYARLISAPDAPGQRRLLEEILQVNFDPLKVVHWIELEADSKEKEGKEKPASPRIRWALHRAPVRVADRLKERLYEPSRSIIFTSATLTVAGSGFNFFLDRLGLEDYIEDEDLIRLPAEFNYEERVLLCLPSYLQASARYEELDRFKEEATRELDCLFKFTEGRGLVLHTARDRMEYVAERLEHSLGQAGIPVYWRGSRKLLKEEFESREESVLLGLKSFWEGIDVPGPPLSYVVIEKLPFPSLGDPVVKARSDEVHARGRHAFMDYILPLATIQFKQGFGRLMRKKDDMGVVLFLDKRLRGDAFYREIVLNSLPGYKRPEEVIEAEESRQALYHQIALHMREAFPGFNWEERLKLFPCIREEVIPDLERLLQELKLPDRVPEGEYPQYRDKILRAAKEIFGYDDFKVPEQEEAIKAILTGKDVMVVLPTGSGKSFAFQVTALLRDGVTLVFSPLIALMRDQVDKLKEKGLTMVDYIVSGQSGAHRDEVYRRMAKGELKLVYIAPERIRDPALAEVLGRTKVLQVVVDEAHCVHMWGYSFRPDFLGISDLFGEDRPPIVALTATATHDSRKSIAEGLKLREDWTLVTRSVDRPELKFIVYNAKSSPDRIESQRDKLRILTKLLRAAQQRDESVIVYVSTVREAEDLARILNFSGFTVRAYHGRMNAQDREEVQELFRNDIVKIVVATKAFGLGIDKPDIRYVIHYDIPGDIESYFQEAGRAGRDGKEAYCVLLYHKNDLTVQKYFIREAFPSEEELQSLAFALREHINKRGQILVSPQELADESGVTLEKLDVALHLLERMGFIRRSYNFTLTAMVLLNRSKEWLLRQLPSEKGQLLERIVKGFGVSDKRSIELNLLEVSYKIGCDPLELDKLFVELSTKGWAVYRPWERGYTFEASERLQRGERVNLDQAEVEALRKSMERNLRRMIYYAEGLGAGDCRRQFILRYFGEELKEHPSPCCDLCHPDILWLWRDISSEEVEHTTVSLDPSYIALRAVEWNESLLGMKYHQPYTENTLACILSGNTYAPSRGIEDPVRRIRRIQRLKNSPYFAVLRGIPGGKRKIMKILEKLRKMGYTKLKTLPLRHEENICYEAPFLENKGKRQIQEGRYLWLDLGD